MTSSIKGILVCNCTLFLLIVAHRATATRLSSPLMVYAAVTDNCSVSTDSGRLAAYDPILVALPGSANDMRSLAIKCTTGTDPEISVASTHIETERGAGRTQDTVVATVMF